MRNEENIKTGWLRLYRSLLEWEYFTDINTTHLFIYFLLKANIKDKKWRGVKIERGSFITSFSSLAENTGLTTQQVRTSLQKLKKSQNVTSKSTNKFTHITVCNYDGYQAPESSEQQAHQQTNNKQITNKQQTNNNN